MSNARGLATIVLPERPHRCKGTIKGTKKRGKNELHRGDVPPWTRIEEK